MRPRVFPAEDVGALLLGLQLGSASMRPRVFPAEDVEGGERSLIEITLQ